MKHQPPAFFMRLFRWFCKSNLHPYLEGDLLEHFQEKVEKQGLKKARRAFGKDVIKLFRPGIVRSFIPQHTSSHSDMFKHNLIITLRSFKRNFGSFLINLLGLTTALTAVLLICLWINDEASVDQFHEKNDRLFQVFLNAPTPYGTETNAGTQVLLAPTLTAEFPEVEQAASVIPYEWFDGEKFVLSNGNDRFFTSRNQFASEDYFDLFSFNLISGDQNALLSDKTSVVISVALASKLFDDTDVVGNMLEWIHEDYGGVYQVSGVFETLSTNSTQQFDAVFSFEVIKEDEGDSWLEWTESDPSTFVTLKTQADYEGFNQKLSSLTISKNKNLQSSLYAQPFGDTYLYDQYENGLPAGGRIAYLKLFGIIGILILLIASINFMIMSTAKAVIRMKEIGVKKAMGAYRSHLAAQYLLESISITLIALVIAVVLTWGLLPQFNELTGKAVSLELNGQFIGYLFIAALITGFLAGSYPALYLSGFSPVKALKGQLKSSVNGQLTRKSLIVFQFAISTILIVSVIVVSRQINFIQSKDLGFDKDRVISFTMGKIEAESDEDNVGLSKERIENFLQLLKNTPGITHSTNFAHNVLGAYGTTTGLNWQDKDPEVSAQFAQIAGGYELIETMGMQMAAGRSYSHDFASDIDKIILNQAAVKAIGYDNPVGKSINLWGQDREIIGVVKDFHIDMLYEDIKPAFISLALTDFASQVMVKLSSGSEQATIARIEQVYEDYFIAGIPFEYHYLNEDYQQFYAQELRVGAFTQYATGVALFITCLGLISFASFTLQRRLREIAIRKILGSSLWQVVTLLFSTFIKLTFIAFVIAIPISFLISKNWLEAFAYRVDLELWYFLVAGGSAMIITIATVGYQTLRATRTNAIEHLSLEQ